MISGDGLLNEVLNAIVTRFLPDGLQPSDPSFHTSLHSALHTLPIALLPGGTSNGLVSSLFGRQLDVVDMVKRIMVSSPRSVDIISIQTPVEDANQDPCATEFSRTHTTTISKKSNVKVDMLCFLYGIVADNGELRMTVNE